jgi:sugar phosphate isomerase/epimerase
MILSMLLNSLPLPCAAALQRAAALGFTHVDVVGRVERPEKDLEVLADTGLLVCCAAIGKGLPEGHALDALEVEPRRVALEMTKRQVDDASRLGATHAYLGPGTDYSSRARTYFDEACVLLADHAGQRKVRLCMEPVPGKPLASAADVLAWLERIGHPNLALLLDVGHCLLSGEEPARMVRQAGQRLGYVHLDDNDGVSDLHWPLLTGCLTEAILRATLAALTAQRYSAALTLELKPENPEPEEGLRKGKALLERLLRHP